MTLGETAKNAWSNPSTEPPVPHAEEWTVAELCGETNRMPADQAMEDLRQAGFTGATAKSNMKELATKSGRRPIEVAQST